ncbi:hypothetical protein GQ42DRAFT_152243 [Ramicandelaber brevisporus]|nr:hypothetical protein GQ42DRAFT_152243 [Ramicandelaber brevisporus]
MLTTAAATGSGRSLQAGGHSRSGSRDRFKSNGAAAISSTVPATAAVVMPSSNIIGKVPLNDGYDDASSDTVFSDIGDEEDYGFSNEDAAALMDRLRETEERLQIAADLGLEATRQNEELQGEISRTRFELSAEQRRRQSRPGFAGTGGGRVSAGGMVANVVAAGYGSDVNLLLSGAGLQAVENKLRILESAIKAEVRKEVESILGENKMLRGEIEQLQLDFDGLKNAVNSSQTRALQTSTKIQSIEEQIATDHESSLALTERHIRLEELHPKNLASTTAALRQLQSEFEQVSEQIALLRDGVSTADNTTDVLGNKIEEMASRFEIMADEISGSVWAIKEQIAATPLFLDTGDELILNRRRRAPGSDDGITTGQQTQQLQQPQQPQQPGVDSFDHPPPHSPPSYIAATSLQQQQQQQQLLQTSTGDLNGILSRPSPTTSSHSRTSSHGSSRSSSGLVDVVPLRRSSSNMSATSPNNMRMRRAVSYSSIGIQTDDVPFNLDATLGRTPLRNGPGLRRTAMGSSSSSNNNIGSAPWTTPRRPYGASLHSSKSLYNISANSTPSGTVRGLSSRPPPPPVPNTVDQSYSRRMMNTVRLKSGNNIMAGGYGMSLSYQDDRRHTSPAGGIVKLMAVGQPKEQGNGTGGGGGGGNRRDLSMTGSRQKSTGSDSVASDGQKKPWLPI